MDESGSRKAAMSDGWYTLFIDEGVVGAGRSFDVEKKEFELVALGSMNGDKSRRCAEEECVRLEWHNERSR